MAPTIKVMGASLPDARNSSSSSRVELLNEHAGQDATREVPENNESGDTYQHLPPRQAEILKRQVLTPDVQTGFRTIYRYTSRMDTLVLAVSAICAITAGAALPMMSLIFGNLQGIFQGYLYGDGTETYEEFVQKLSSFVMYYVYLSAGMFITTYICTVGFISTGERITARIRERYFESCMRQNIGFFDKVGAGEITTHITANTNMIQEGISQKLALSLSALATFTAAFIIGFVTYWKLALIVACGVVALTLNVRLGTKFMFRYSKSSLESYAQGGSLASEVISSIRNTIAFGTQGRLASQYEKHLDKAEYYGFRAKRQIALMVAIMWLIFFSSYALAFWQGSGFLVDGAIPISKLLIITMSVMMGSSAFGAIMPNIQALTTAIAASSKIFNVIERVSPLDPTNEDGITLDHNIHHIYPSRSEVVVLQDMTLDVPAGKTTALVGGSGSGKKRFYDPVQGTIYLDGHDISKLNLRWLRQQISLVSQEPTLFGTTVYHNIRYGLIGTSFEHEGQERQRDLANAHAFVSELPNGYDTHVGEGGFLLSGGQKQRIAIARAIVSDPKILLLDEATSALDTNSEGVVQAALAVASAGRTTISIAHRLSTIKDAHNIVVMSQGRIVEQGTHDELLTTDGAYSKLVSAQEIATDEAMEAEVEAELSEQDIFLPEAIQKSMEQTATQNQKPPKLMRRYNSVWTLVSFVASLNKPEWKLMLAGLIFSTICGGGTPVSAIIYANQVATLSQPLTELNRQQIKSDSDFWSCMYIALACVQSVSYGLQGVAFAVCSERLVHRVRDRAFRSMLRQDAAFFDQDENTAGALTSFLSTEATHVAGMSGITLGTILMMLTTLLFSTTISIVIGWKLALVCMSTIPVLLACGFLRVWMLAYFQRRSKAVYAMSATFASEMISSIRTVASLTGEQDIIKQYRDFLAVQQRQSFVSVLLSSALYAASQSVSFLCSGLGFWYGGTLIGKGEYDMFQFFLCFMTVIVGGQAAGGMFTFAPDMGKAHHAAQELKILFDRQPAIDPYSDEGEPVEEMEGAIEFQDVHFRYPTRLDQPVLRGLSLSALPGQFVALVGSSGCGKSTAIALIERFYDPLAGGVYVDGTDISSLSITDYRSFIALVSQEPTLYQGTIKDNIALGSGDGDVSEEAIEMACREANIYDFIVSLPEGFNTEVGSRGVMLSGGQKQRIAIARALIRNPKILLLDEATSALDSESEQVVQEALDKAAKGRTTIAVAHRLSTIQKADVIYVLDQGRIIETGKHADLMARNGRYAELVNQQSLSRH
ncbi:abc transporter [Xylariales sp. PMI_506]|nr:abc transporter [Xylariales sp. PMI_506]